MIGTMDIRFGREEPRPERVARSAPALTAAEEKIGLRGEGEAAVYRAVRSAGGLSTLAAVVRASGLPEVAATRALRSLQDRRIIRRDTSGLGTERFVVAR